MKKRHIAPRFEDQTDKNQDNFVGLTLGKIMVKFRDFFCIFPQIWEMLGKIHIFSEIDPCFFHSVSNEYFVDIIVTKY